MNENKIINTIIEYNNGIYEGQIKNNKNEGKGIYYYNNGDRSMGDYQNDLPIGRHAKLTKNRDVETINY